MMNRTMLGLAGAALGTAMMAGTASAALIDFGDGSWNGANGLASFTSDPRGVNLFASDTSPLGTAKLTAPNGGDGIGICTFDALTDDCDEVDDFLIGSETLTVTFDAAVSLGNILLSNFFTKPPESSGTEKGFYSINGGPAVAFTANSVTGDFSIAVNLDGVTSLVLTANNDQFSDFTLQGLTTVDAPEPGTLALFGAALAGIGLARRRRRS